MRHATRNANLLIGAAAAATLWRLRQQVREGTEP
jgi:hypothetical protein